LEHPTVDGTGQVIGTDGNDTLIGTRGRDKLLGGLDDVIFGRPGQDTLSGGEGRDAFVFDTKPHRTLNVDRITDFAPQDDSIYVPAVPDRVGEVEDEGKEARHPPFLFIFPVIWKYCAQ
jgi:Ca2+-binding RTX toxin-like protein